MYAHVFRAAGCAVLLLGCALFGTLPTTVEAGPAPPSLPQAAIPWPVNDGTLPYWALREQQNEVRAKQGPADILFLGDSITDNFQNGVGRPVWNLYFATLRSADFAVGGITTSQVLWQVRAGQVAAVSPKLIILMIGTNNLGLGQSPADTAAGVAAIVNEIRRQLPQTHILVLGLLPRGQTPADPFRAKIAQVNRAIGQLADGKRVQYLDIGSSFLLRSGWIPASLMPDFLHPSLAGYRIYAAAIWPSVRAALWGV